MKKVEMKKEMAYWMGYYMEEIEQHKALEGHCRIMQDYQNKRFGVIQLAHSLGLLVGKEFSNEINKTVGMESEEV